MSYNKIRILFFPLMLVVLMSMGVDGNCMGASFSLSEDATYRPFIEDGKRWVVTYSYAHGWLPPYKAECYYIDGDTLVGTQLCKKLMVCINDIENNSRTIVLDKLIFEKDKKVFYCPANKKALADEFIKLYDFSACIGDTLSLGGISNAEATATQCFQIWETPMLKCQYSSFNGQLATLYDPNLTERDVFETGECPLYHWYETIGSTEHPFLKIRSDYDGTPELLRDCRVNDRVIYMNWLDEILFPDVTCDGMIDVGDVNTIISIMLKNNDLQQFDIVYDGVIDIADINAIINAMLGEYSR